MKGWLCRGTMLLLGLGCLGGWSRAVQADPARGWYLNGGLGISHLDQEESKEEKADIGFHLGGACGYRFNRWWALEAESGFIHNSIPARDEAEEASGLSQIPLVFNAVFHIANESKLEPYLSAGFGGTLAWTEEDSGGDATLAFKAGVRHGINERMAIGIDYTFFMLGFASAIIGEAVGNDTVNLGVRWMF